MVVEETEERMGRVLLAYGIPLAAVPSFKYLGCILLPTNNDWPEVKQNLRQARVNWGQMVRTLGREVTDRRKAGRFYVELVQEVLFFGSETWVVTPRMEKALTDFNHWEV